MKIGKLIFVFLAVGVLSGCVSIQQRDITVDTHRNQMEGELAKLEELIVPLEAVGGTEARRRPNELAAARKMVSDLEREFSADAYFSAQLTAWSGRLAILEGRFSEAQRLYRQSLAGSAGNVPKIILGIRLEGDPAIRFGMIERELAVAGNQGGHHGFGELQIERGRTLFELERYAEAAGAFDTAFGSGLPGVYRDSYSASRDRAWSLRHTDGVRAGTINLIGRDGITWNDSIAITRNETQLLRFISGGRNLSDAEFFNRLVERAFIPHTQDINLYDWPAARPRADELVTRAGAAWFIWHLHAEARGDRGMLSRYSARFATGTNPRSPIADVPPLSPFFDSILGCVETELLNLPDGRNFRPSLPISGAELLTILKRIDN